MDQLALATRFFDGQALAIVWGGALLAAVLRGGWGGVGPALRAARLIRSADPERDAAEAMGAARRVEAIASAKSITCADQVSATARFLGEAVRHLSDARSSAAFAAWAAAALDARRRRHAARIAFWRDMADAAPAMGMLATVVGLVSMFAHMDDPSRIGAPMASALVATLWGILVANLVAGPIADRLERLSEAELAWQARTLDLFATLARAELDRPVAVPPRQWAA